MKGKAGLSDLGELWELKFAAATWDTWHFLHHLSTRLITLSVINGLP